MIIGKLGGDGLADDEGACGAQLCNHRRVVAAAAAGTNRRSTFGGIISRIEDILDRDRNAEQRAHRAAFSAPFVERPSLRKRMLPIQMREGLDLRITRGDAIEA